MMSNKRPILTALAAAVVLSGVAGCGTASRVGGAISKLNPFGGKDSGDKATATPGKRIPVLAPDQSLEPADALKGTDFFIPDASPRDAWPLPGGTPEQAVENIDAAHNFSIAWRRGFGQGTGKGSREA